MKILLSLGVGFLTFTMTILSGSTMSGSQDREVNAGIRDRFVGAWRLAWLEEEAADGKIHKADSTGLLVFTRDGHMSVQVMERNPQAQTAAGPERYSQGGYEASLANMRSTNAFTTSHITLRAPWCGPLSAKTCRVHSSSRANS